MNTVIYSIYPPEVVLQSESGQPANYFNVDLDGRTFTLEMVNGRAQIVRLISTDPRDYLRPEWQPGQTIDLWHRNRVR